MLTLEKAQQLIDTTTTEAHLKAHALAVMAAMGGMAEHFKDDKEHWQAIGYLHDYDYEQYPTEHLQHTAEPLRQEGVDEVEIRAILSHGYSHCSSEKPITDMEKSLYTVDELTGIISAASKMRPNGILDLEISSFMKKFKDLKFAAKCDRELIKGGCELLGMDVKEVSEICIEGMRPYAQRLGLGAKE